jgi:hypothetical protein
MGEIDNQTKPSGNDLREKSRISEESLFFNRIIPILLVGMGVLMFFLILFAAGVLLGLIKF